MLIELTVRNLAIFEDVRVPFSAGLNVVTGETGAGKSLLVEAIRLALGEKADPVAVRTGEPEAEVTALFDLSRRDDLRDAWEEAGLPWEEEVVLRRVLPAAGRSRAYLNGRPVAQPVLAALSPLLLTMVGQHSVPELLSRAAALSAVDDFAGAGALSSEMRKRYRRVAALRRQAAEAADRGAGARSRTETLDFEIGELSKAALTPGEEEELAADLSLLRNAAKVREALQAADDAIASSENAALASMAFALARLREAAAVDPRLSEIAERLRSAREEVQDLSRELGSLAVRVTEDPERRERVEERLSAIRRLKRKYGKEVPELVSHLDLAPVGARVAGRGARGGGAAAKGARRRGGGRGRGGEEALRDAPEGGGGDGTGGGKGARAGRPRRGAVPGGGFLPRGGPRGAFGVGDRRGGAPLLREPRPGASTARADRLGRGALPRDAFPAERRLPGGRREDARVRRDRHGDRGPGGRARRGAAEKPLRLPRRSSASRTCRRSRPSPTTISRS